MNCAAHCHSALPTFDGITRPTGTLFSEEGLTHLAKQSNAPYPLSPIPYP